jgi:hypothetical protein
MIYFTLEVSYPLNNVNDLSVTDSMIEKTVGEMSTAGGAGMGFRDLVFEFTTRRKANLAQDKLCNLKIDGLTSEVDIRDE